LTHSARDHATHATTTTTTTITTTITITLSFSRALRSLGALSSSLPHALKAPRVPAVADMTWLQNLNPVPAFPAYTGAHKVGSVDVEIPTSELESPGAEAASPAELPPTVAFRVFYPCRQDSKQKPVKWIPSPQREYIGAYAKFLGANSAFASVFS
jgi:hypothetical protein